MDTGYDFIQPEFLDILFFQQKNLVIYPYIDLKHFHTLQIFTTGYDTVDIDATAIHNLQEIIDYEKSSSYSQQPTLYLLYNVDTSNIRKLLSSNSIRFIVNTNENVDNMVNDLEVVFYNKKMKLFFNYTPNNLEFENYLIKSSSNETILLEKIQQIKTIATKIYSEINEKGHLKDIAVILEGYNSAYWSKILQFTEKYYNIELPKNYLPKSSQRTVNKIPLKDFSFEYELIMKSNKHIAQEFIQLIHEYRSKRVNAANLDVAQLYYPQKLYNYLRNHHWEKGIPSDFVEEWIKLYHTKYSITEQDITNFEALFQNLGISSISLRNSEFEPVIKYKQPNIYSCHNSGKSTPSVKNFQEFKDWIIKKLDELERYKS